VGNKSSLTVEATSGMESESGASADNLAVTGPLTLKESPDYSAASTSPRLGGETPICSVEGKAQTQTIPRIADSVAE